MKYFTIRHTARKRGICVPHSFMAFILKFLTHLWGYMGSVITQGYPYDFRGYQMISRLGLRGAYYQKPP